MEPIKIHSFFVFLIVACFTIGGVFMLTITLARSSYIQTIDAIFKHQPIQSGDANIMIWNNDSLLAMSDRIQEIESKLDAYNFIFGDLKEFSNQVAVWTVLLGGFLSFIFWVFYFLKWRVKDERKNFVKKTKDLRNIFWNLSNGFFHSYYKGENFFILRYSSWGGYYYIVIQKGGGFLRFRNTRYGCYKLMKTKEKQWTFARRELDKDFLTFDNLLYKQFCSTCNIPAQLRDFIRQDLPHDTKWMIRNAPSPTLENPMGIQWTDYGAIIVHYKPVDQEQSEEKGSTERSRKVIFDNKTLIKGLEFDDLTKIENKAMMLKLTIVSEPNLIQEYWDGGDKFHGIHPTCMT